MVIIMNYGTCFPITGEIKTECLSVALLQMSVKKPTRSYEDIDENIANLFKWMERTVAGLPGVDFMITPETALHGFSPLAAKLPIKLSDDKFMRIAQKCKELQVWLTVGAIIDKEDGSPVQNGAITFNNQGEMIDVYTKTNPWNPLERNYPGSEIKVYEGPKGAKIATIICADGDYQDTWREAEYKGANVIVRISAYMTPYEKAYEITNRAGAYYNRCYVLATNEVGLDEAYCWFGNSMAVNPDGEVFASAPTGIPWVLKCDVYPGLADKIKTQSLMGYTNYLANHRGGANPLTHKNGRMGLDKSMYSYINGTEENHKC